MSADAGLFVQMVGDTFFMFNQIADKLEAWFWTGLFVGCNSILHTWTISCLFQVYYSHIVYTLFGEVMLSRWSKFLLEGRGVKKVSKNMSQKDRNYSQVCRRYYGLDCYSMVLRGLTGLLSAWLVWFVLLLTTVSTFVWLGGGYSAHYGRSVRSLVIRRMRFVSCWSSAWAESTSVTSAWAESSFTSVWAEYWLCYLHLRGLIYYGNGFVVVSMARYYLHWIWNYMEYLLLL